MTNHLTDALPYATGPHFCECGRQGGKTTIQAQKILSMTKELCTMPANFSELRLQLLHLLDEHDKLVEGKK